MAVILFVLFVVAIVAVWWIVSNMQTTEVAPPQPIEVPGLSLSGVGVSQGAIIGQQRVQEIAPGLSIVTRSPVLSSLTQKPQFTHTINTSVACAWLVTFIKSAGEAKLYTLGSVQQAMGRPKDAPPWDYASKVLEATAPATSVVVPLLAGGALAAGALIAAPISVAVGFISLLVGLDSDIKARIAEAEACNGFVDQFCQSYSLPPMALLYAMSNLVPTSRNYGLYRGSGSAFDRSQEYGVGIVAEMTLLFEKLREKGILHGIPAIGDVSILNQIIGRREVSISLGNAKGKLNVSRLSPFWGRYLFSIHSMFAEPSIPRWSSYPDIILSAVLGQRYKMTNNPFLFDREAMRDWMTRGGTLQGEWKGRLQPEILNFEIGHDPSLDDYGFDTGFLSIGAGGTKPRIAKQSWVCKFDIDTNGGWMYVQ